MNVCTQFRGLRKFWVSWTIVATDYDCRQYDEYNYAVIQLSM